MLCSISPVLKSQFLESPNHTGTSVYSRMPVDFASYLLAASPPGFDLQYQLRDHFGISGNALARNQRRNGGPLKSIISHSSKFSTDCEETCESFSNTVDKDGDQQPEIDVDDLIFGDLDLELDGPSNEPSSPTNTAIESTPNLSLSKSRKKVSFADESGLALVAVRILTDGPDAPPHLRPELFASLTQGALASVTDTPPLVLNFAQPASDYVSFRDKLNTNFVSLENVILKDYNLLGTVKVKNIAFEKHVKVRVSYNGWQSHTDIPCSHVPSADPVSPYDTFSFQICVSPNMDLRQKIQFAVCFEASGQQYWDNYNDKNYEVVSADFNSMCLPDTKHNTTDQAVYSLQPPREGWTGFSGWQDMDKEVPYW